MRKPTVKKTVRGTRSRFNALRELGKLATATVHFGYYNSVIRCFPSSMTPSSIRRACSRKYDDIKKIVVERSGEEPLVLNF